MTGEASELRAAARTVRATRGLDRRPIWDSLPYLAEDVGRLITAVRQDDLPAVRAELATCVALLDHIAECYGGAELTALLSDLVTTRRPRATAPSAW